ncbi:MAG: helix-hairpin-helix domain-containing protein [Chloroflexota bacterium]|nr:helix-hairpin-helix domain-containing protein [Chloroflexota bacterium]
MLDRSTRTLLAVGFLLAAVLVTLWMIVRQRPIEEWWLPLLLWLLGLLLVWYWQRGGKEDAVGTEVSPPAVAAAPAPRVRELVVSDAPAAALPAPAAFVAKVDTPPVVSEEAQAVEEMIAEEAASAAPAVAVASVPVPETAAEEATPVAPELTAAVASVIVPEAAAAPETESISAPSASEPASSVSMQEADVTEVPAVNISTFAAPVVPDDLKLVEGIGPKMEKALHNAGILTFAHLADATVEQIRAAILAAGMRFAPSVPTWAKQAHFLADGDTDGLTAYQNQLTAGREG